MTHWKKYHYAIDLLPSLETQKYEIPRSFVIHTDTPLQVGECFDWTMHERDRPGFGAQITYQLIRITRRITLDPQQESRSEEENQRIVLATDWQTSPEASSDCLAQPIEVEVCRFV
ncbi:hypothetical protein IFO70_29985 [Phormidium tenue FACHB-886]|nr:hypothetical protein [Phormidium tenue FACHB-886]